MSKRRKQAGESGEGQSKEEDLLKLTKAKAQQESEIRQARSKIANLEKERASQASN